MKLTQITMVLALAFPVAALAHGDKAGKAGRVEDKIAKMDTDGDGKLSAAEHTAGARKMFETMDANGDTRVTAAEMTASHEKTGKKAIKGEMSVEAKIKAIDTDGDGALTAEEHAAGASTKFTRMDTDKDGFLTKEELVAGHKMMMKDHAKAGTKEPAKESTK